jgi:hypothetical protein
VVGKTLCDSKKTTELVSSFATVSDIAFILLTLENNWDFWSSIKANQVTEVTEGVESAGNDGDQGTTAFPTATKWTSTSMHGGKNSGWTKEGLLRFNRLCEIETSNRESNQSVETAYMEAKKNESTGARKKRRLLAPHGVIAYIDESMFGNI